MRRNRQHSTFGKSLVPMSFSACPLPPLTHPSGEYGVCSLTLGVMPCGGMRKPTQSSPKVRHNPASKSSPRQPHSENDGTCTSPFGASRQRSSNWTYAHGCPWVSPSRTTSPARHSTVNIHVSALVETFQSHLDGGLGSWNISVADNFTMESQTLWHGSRLLRNDWIRKQTERKLISKTFPAPPAFSILQVAQQVWKLWTGPVLPLK
jgi:hypothetical protein